MPDRRLRVLELQTRQECMAVNSGGGYCRKKEHVFKAIDEEGGEECNSE